MPGLPYWKNSTAAVNYYEPVFRNQFEVILTPPPVITGPNVALLVEHVTKITGLPEIQSSGSTLAEQKYKFATRSFAAALPDTTVADLEISFTVNLNEENDAYIYNILRAWNDIPYNPLTGSQGLKKDYVGQLSVHATNKAGDIFREWVFPSVIPNGKLNALDLEYVATDLYAITMKYRADYWNETRVGQIIV
jgi:hypothetical protein